jgi:hypothetical protein
MSLNADSYREILDVIDRLRQHGLNSYVDLPQIIVCGDQSCGKSSALEAISGMSFPFKDTLCTRFATELILRHSSRCGIDIKIIPDPHRSTAEKERLQAFSYTVTEELDLARVIEEAKGAMCLNGGSKVFSTDVLRVEISGPNQPHLTLVDLPGLFLAGNKDQSEQDAEMVEKLALSYMSNPRTIILAVVSAKSDFAVQQVTRLARSQDPRGSRTMGLITKPDTLDRGSESERFYVELAQNKDVKFQLGWHVLRNRSFAERNASPAVRDANEEAFFASGVWASALKPDQLGAAALRVRLSKLLWQQIMRQLPAVNDDVMKGIDECRVILSRLGPARVTADDKRHYLLHVSSRFSELAKAAVDGIYTDPFFRTSRSHRLRAIVQNTLSAFAREISLNGHAMTIVEDDEVLEVRPGGMEVDDERRKITRAAFIESVRELMRESRGRELPGTYNPLIVAELFSKQCKPWQGMVRKLQEKVFQTAVEVVTAMLGNTMGDAGAAQRLFHQVLKPALMSLKVDLQMKAAEILRPHLSGHPITYDPSLMESVRQAQVVRRRQQMEQRVKQFFHVTMLPFGTCTHKFDMHRLLDELANVSEPDMDTYSCSLAVDTMESYYKVRRTFAQKFTNGKPSLTKITYCTRWPYGTSSTLSAASPSRVPSSNASRASSRLRPSAGWTTA